MSLRLGCCLAAALVAAGCSLGPWPPERGGGLSERVPGERLRFASAGIGESESELYRSLLAREAVLEALLAAGAFRWAPAEVTLAEKLTVRIRRQIAGDLMSPARVDLIELDERILIIRAAMPWRTKDDMRSL